MFVAGGLKNTCSLAWMRNPPPPKKRKKSPKPHVFPSAGVVAGDLQAAAPPAGAAGGGCALSPQWRPQGGGQNGAPASALGFVPSAALCLGFLICKLERSNRT